MLAPAEPRQGVDVMLLKIQTTAFALILYLCDGAQDQSKAAVR
ncbi:hypothetical protein [Streptomyces anulatus]